MKRSGYLNLLTVLLLLTAVSTGCKLKPKNPTPIPGRSGSVGNDANTDGLIGRNAATTEQPGVTSEQLPRGPQGEIPLGEGFDISKSHQDRETLKSYTVYFDLDSATIKASENGKLESVAGYLRGNATAGVLIEGHCDERGTEQYNLSLGERRALAAREYLANLGIQAERIHTISYGETHPVDFGHKESAWKKNRRDEFIVLTPKQ
jgi:peptidoglycan-associated lipoprotein